jgi:hypothetical protein
MGKYTDVIAKAGLKPAPIEDLGYQGKIDRLKADIRGACTTAECLARNYASARALKDELAAQIGSVNDVLEAYQQLLVESHEAGEAGWGQYGARENALRLATGAVVRIDKEPVGKVVDKEQFRLWCVANGLEQSLQLWPSTMNAIAKERLLAGAAPPDGVDVHFWEKIVYTKP